MKLALVQYCHRGLAIKLAATIEELLMINFQFNPSQSPPRIHKVSDEVCLDDTGAKLSAEIDSQRDRGEFKVLRLP